MRLTKRLSALLAAVFAFGGAGCGVEDKPSMDDRGFAGTGAPVAGTTGGAGGAAGMVIAGAGAGVAGVGTNLPPIDLPTAGMNAGTGGAAGMAIAGAGGEGGGDPVPPAQLLSATVAIPQIAPGDQLTVCTTRFLDNETEVKVKNVRGHISGGSHHFIVDRAPTDVAIEGFLPCPGLAGTDATRVLIAEKPETVFTMPPNVGFTLRPHQALTGELHYFNPTDAPLDIEAIIEFEVATPEEAATMKEASMVFTGPMSIFLSPNSAGVAEYFHQMPGSLETPVRVFALTSHTHSLGVRATIERAANATAPGELLHESLSWAEPPMTEFMPELEFSGGDGLRLKCEYFNDRDTYVNFGTAVQDEMCFMWLYYY